MTRKTHAVDEAGKKIRTGGEPPVGTDGSRIGVEPDRDVRIAFGELFGAVERVLLRLGLAPARAALGARLIAETDRDGVRTHGIARLPRFAEMVRLGRIHPLAEPECVGRFGALERWRGHRGPGNLAAHAAMARAVALAAEHGIGAVALADTTHWQRGGSYGWQAADAGCAALCWTNTLPNLPPWGASSPALGNNPLVIAVPRQRTPNHSADQPKDGTGEPETHGAPQQEAPVVLDMAMSQFSYGTLAAYRERGELLPVAGGFDAAGELTRDPAAVESTQRALPVGFWKGSGLAFALDVFAAMMSGGLATHQIAPDPMAEVGQSQMFIAMAPGVVADRDRGHAEMRRMLDGAVAALHAATPLEPGRVPRYPGEGTLRLRRENERLGVLLDRGQWQAVLRLGQ